MQVLLVEELVVLSPCILIYSYKTISFPLRRQKQSYKLSIFSSAGNNHFRKDIHCEVHRYESSWQTSPLEKKGSQKTSHLHPSEWVMGKKLFQKGGRRVPQNPRGIQTWSQPGEQQTQVKAVVPLTSPVLQQSRNSMALESRPSSSLYSQSPLHKKSPKRSIKSIKIKGCPLCWGSLLQPRLPPTGNISLLQHGHVSLGILKTATVGRDGLSQ